MEKLVLSKVSSYFNSHNHCHTFQSAYRPGHSTETALLKVVNDHFLSLSKGNISVLALLDFSSAFDTIDHTILVHLLHTEFGFTDTVLQWFSSYLSDRTHYVSLSNHCSSFALVHSGDTLGSVLDPIHFTMYIKPLSAIIDSHSTIHHSFSHSSTAPSYVTDMLHKKPLHTRNTRSSSYTMPLLNRPAHSKATLGDRSFSFASSSVWNSIPNDVKCAPSLSSFKSRLKTYLFRSVYKD